MVNPIAEEIRRTQIPIAKVPIIKARKTLHKGALFGHVSNGGGIIKLDDEYAIKFIAKDSKFVTIYLLDYGKNLKIDTQSWQKTKEVTKTDNNKIEIKDEKENKEDLF